MKLVLLHSPLAAPATWDALAPVLRAQGHEVAVPDLRPGLTATSSFYKTFADIASAATKDAVLVAHSGAGALVPAIAARVMPAAVIFTDALLPHPGRSWFDTASPPLAAHLRGLAQGGVLPPWDRWWPKGTMERLLPDDTQRAHFIASVPRVPVAYLDEIAPDSDAMPPAAYLQLSGSYDTEAEVARAKGWLVSRLDLQHLAMLTEPVMVAAAIARLAEGM